MASCCICSESKLHVCLPCGHVFCLPCSRITVQTVKPPTSMHQCPTCGSLYNGSLDTKTLCSVATPSVRPLHMDAARSDMGGHVPAHSSWRFSEPSTQISGVQSSSVPSAGPSDDKVPIEMARLRAENHALRNNCSMWRKRAEAHGEANLNLLKFARALRDQASQIARDRNELETRCFMLKKQLDGDCSYSNEMQKLEKSKQSSTVPDLGLSKQIGKDRSHYSSPPPLGLGNSLPRLDSYQSKKRSRTS